MEILLNLLIILANITLGLIILIRNIHSATNRLFFCISIVLSVWTIFNFFSVHANSPNDTLLWIRIILFIAAFKPPLLFLFFHTFPGEKLKLSPKKIWWLFLFPSISAILALTPLVFSHVDKVGNQYQPVPGVAMPLWGGTFFILLIAGFGILAKRYKQESGQQRTQTLFVLLGFVLSFSFFIVTNFVMVNEFHNSSLVFIGPLFTIILVAIMSYAIIKHNFLDIRFIIARTLSYAIVLFVVAAIYNLILLRFASVITKVTLNTNEAFLFTVISLFMAFSFQFFRRSFETMTDKVFFKGTYNSQEVLKSLSYIMSTTLELRDLSDQVLEKILKEMRLTRGAFVLFDRKWKYISFILQKGLSANPHLVTYQTYDYIKTGSIILFDDLHESPLKEFMRKDNIHALLPLIVHDQKIGVLFLGEKASGDAYSQKDTNILEIIAPQLAIAIQNAQEFEEIKRFNLTLRQEINRETKELQNANERLKQLDKLKDEFVSLASHELRTPMTAIKSYLWMYLEAHKDTIATHDIHYLKRAYESTDRLIRLVNDMLNVSRIEGGRMTINRQPSDIVGIATSVLSDILPQAQKQTIQLVLNKPETQIPILQVDPDKIKEVFFNLVGNSLKFTPSNGTVTVTIAEAPDSVLVKISDTGKGIKKEDLPKLFQKFGMIESQYTQQQSSKGTGLGLYLSKSIVELHGGRIWVESVEGKGTTFFFTLPVQHAQAAVHPAVAAN